MAKLENKAKENPKLEQNTLSDGRISLYLEYYLGREETPVLDKNGKRVCQNVYILFFYAQSPDFLKPGLCYLLKFLYL